MPKRIYVVTEQHDEGESKYLVKANNAAQAIRHVSEPAFKAAVATPDDLVELVGKGTKVQEAGEK